jgi:hypothetical protein
MPQRRTGGKRPASACLALGSFGVPDYRGPRVDATGAQDRGSLPCCCPNRNGLVPVLRGRRPEGEEMSSSWEHEICSDSPDQPSARCLHQGWDSQLKYGPRKRRPAACCPLLVARCGGQDRIGGACAFGEPVCLCGPQYRLLHEDGCRCVTPTPATGLGKAPFTGNLPVFTLLPGI